MKCWHCKTRRLCHAIQSIIFTNKDKSIRFLCFVLEPRLSLSKKRKMTRQYKKLRESGTSLLSLFLLCIFGYVLSFMAWLKKNAFTMPKLQEHLNLLGVNTHLFWLVYRYNFEVMKSSVFLLVPNLYDLCIRCCSIMWTYIVSTRLAFIV